MSGIIDLLLSDYLGQSWIFYSKPTGLKNLELHSHSVDELQSPISSLQALRMIHTARPALIHGMRTINDVR